MTISVSIATSSSPTRNTKELTIQFTSFSAGDSGVYHCNAISVDRSLLSRSISLSGQCMLAKQILLQ